VSATCSAFVFLEDNIQNPVAAVFHTPVSPYRFCEELHIQSYAAQVVAFFFGGLSILFGDGLNPKSEVRKSIVWL
jgi:hypothetical protein